LISKLGRLIQLLRAVLGSNATHTDARAAPNPPPRGVLNPLKHKKEMEENAAPNSQSQAAPGSSPEGTEMLSPEWKGKATAISESASTASSFSIFACLDGVTQANSDLIDEAALEDQMQEVSDFLLQNTSFSDRRAYRECPEASRRSVYSLIEKQGAELAKATDVRSSQQRDYEDQIDVFNAADLVFRFFFPPQVEIPTVSRYWGAIQLLIEVSRGPLYKLMQESPNNRG